MSANCLREVVAAIEQRKPRILVHEADPAKGGAGLEELRNELKSTDHRNAIFPEGFTTVKWSRLADFQLQSLTLIVEQMLMSSPTYRGEAGRLKPYIPGSILDKPLVFPHPVVLCECRAVPRRNAGLILVTPVIAPFVYLACQTSLATTQVRLRLPRR